MRRLAILSVIVLALVILGGTRDCWAAGYCRSGVCYGDLECGHNCICASPDPTPKGICVNAR